MNHVSHTLRRSNRSARVVNRAQEFEGFDPLGARTGLRHKVVLFPYGFPAVIKTNDPWVVRNAELSWGAYSRRFRETPIELRIVVSECASRLLPPPPVFRAQANLLTLVSDADNYGCCDLATGFGSANLTRTVIAHGDFFRYHFLEGMIYTLLDTKHLATVHAACVGRNECGVLLVGESGAGKSSFAYACSRRGWTYVSDDASSLVIRRTNRTVLGNPRTFRFRPSVANLFPELEGHVKDRNGKLTLEVRTEQLAHLKWAHEYEIGLVIFLKRNGSDEDAEGLVPVSRSERFRRLFQNPWPSELAIHEDRTAAIARLADAPGYELSYRNFDRAINRLEQLIADRALRG